MMICLKQLSKKDIVEAEGDFLKALGGMLK